MAKPHLSKTDSPADYLTVLAGLNRMPDKAAKHLKSAFAALTERAAHTLQVSRANIWLFTDSNRTTLRCIDSFDLHSGSHDAEGELAIDKFPNYIAALKQERVIQADDATTDPRTVEFLESYLPTHNIKSMLDAPIRQDGEVVGVICLEQKGSSRAWTEAEASFVATMSDFATMALLSHEKDLAETALIHAQKMESLGRLAGGIAHDFNNILMVITGAVDTLKVSADDEELRDRMLTLMTDACDRAQKLTRNLLAFGGHQKLEFKQINSNDLIEALKELTGGIIREDIHVQFDLTKTPGWFQGDQAQLAQVVLNLMINAMDAMPEGGTLKVEALSCEHNGYVGLAVSDTGCGIAEDIRDRIFEPFFTTKGKFGTGLGLSISAGIIKQHNGSLRCAHTSAQGSRFEMRLPGVKQEQLPEPGTETETPLPANGPPARILLVEDEISVRDIVSQMLMVLGFEVFAAENAIHALALLDQQHSVDLLVSDVVMPDMRGPDLYQAALLKQPTLQALFVSGYSEDLINELPTRDQQIGYLSKPFTLAQLRSAVDKIMQSQDAGQA
jgi:signal transduction histidine kinase/ActR/RegA family two-component response regulator